ncbi:MAG: DUF885 domain-containing protein [Labilithrix sp.]|nr:DUF885 domain-containing protein [Labilithrix sp.]MCW5815494.1 DUF885 domain-containing protein [Labilithrix sp.]
MTRLGFALVLATAVLGACSDLRSPFAPTIAALVEAIIDEQLAFVPARGREAGLHEYDARLADYSRAGITRRIARLEAQRAALAGEHPHLPHEVHDVALLKWQIDEQLFWLTERRDWEHDPAFYEELFSVNVYLDREYAPAEERLRRLVEHEEAALLQVPFLRANLKPPIAKPLADVAIQIYEGRAEFLRKDVAARVAGMTKSDELAARFGRANEALAAEAASFAAWLKTVPTDESHALGPALFARLVEVYAGERISLADFERMGEADLARNRALHDRLVKEVPSPARPDDVLAEARKLVDEARDFLEERAIVTLPNQPKAAVNETPPYLRYNSAWLDVAGPFDLALGGSYYITPPDPSWPEEQRAAYVPTLSELRSTTVHEVYPGHYVQSGFLRHAPTRAQKLVGSVTFIEGWAHYAEQMMADEGFGGGTADAKLGMVKQALLRDCRYLVALGIHTKGMTLAQAEKRMIEDCHQRPPVAKQQALRGAFHPWYFAYTLGKLQIQALRAEAQQAVGRRFQLKLFHDALLSHGQGPVGLLRARVLSDVRSGGPYKAP